MCPPNWWWKKWCPCSWAPSLEHFVNSCTPRRRWMRARWLLSRHKRMDCCQRRPSWTASILVKYGLKSDRILKWISHSSWMMLVARLTEETERFPNGSLSEFIVFQQPIADRSKCETTQEPCQIRRTGEEPCIGQIEMQNFVHVFGCANHQKVKSPRVSVMQQKQRPNRHRNKQRQNWREIFLRNNWIASSLSIELRTFPRLRLL